jgi:hypothetical protein
MIYLAYVAGIVLAVELAVLGVGLLRGRGAGRRARALNGTACDP